MDAGAREGRESSYMPKAKEFTVTIADKPGALGKFFLALAERGVNILAFQSYEEEGESLARFVADDMASAMAVLRSLRMIFEHRSSASVIGKVRCADCRNKRNAYKLNGPEHSVRCANQHN